MELCPEGRGTDNEQAVIRGSERFCGEAAAKRKRRVLVYPLGSQPGTEDRTVKAGI